MYVCIYRFLSPAIELAMASCNFKLIKRAISWAPFPRKPQLKSWHSSSFSLLKAVNAPVFFHVISIFKHGNFGVVDGSNTHFFY